jgi:hypothetical protein
MQEAPKQTEPSAALLERVRKLLAKAEDEGVTPHEAEALTAKAAELMARYGIDRALLAATTPSTDAPADRILHIPNPWAAVKAHLLTGLAAAMRCQAVLIPAQVPGSRVHLFGYASDLDRADIMYTSLLIQMHRALAATPVPGAARSPRAWRRSWMLGFATAVVTRVRAAEARAADQATTQTAAGGGPSAEIVLADRALTIRHNLHQAYPRIRTTKVTYTGNGYTAGYREGEKADIGGARIRTRGARELAG